MTITAWSISCLVALVSAFTMSITGFGFALIAAPLLLLFLDLKTVIVFNVFLGAIICLPILWQSRRYVRLGRMTPLVIGSIFGLPVGMYILAQVAAPVLKLLIAALVIIFAVLLVLGYSHRFKKERLGSVIAGFISGMLVTSTGLAGPPVVLFLLNQGWEKDTFRASLAAYFLFVSLMALITLRFSEIITSALLVTVSTFVPAILVGVYLGVKVLPHVDAVLFRRIAIAIVFLAGSLGIATSLSAWL